MKIGNLGTGNKETVATPPFTLEQTDLYVKFVQSVTGYDNKSYDQPKPIEKQDWNGFTYINDIQYGSDYKRSFLDLYLSGKENAPTLFYTHGSGWAAGDKTMPSPGREFMFKLFLEKGYNVVAITYGMTPENRYPSQLHQFAQSVEFLLNHGKKYGISMDKIVFSGASAGGNLAAQYINTQLNPEYAQKVGVKVVLSKENFQATIFYGALFEGSQINSGNNFNDLVFDSVTMSYLGEAGHPNYEENSPLKNATADFPPTFISDGNHGSFANQAELFARRLTELGVKNQLMILPISEGIFTHGFEESDSPQALKVIQKSFEFAIEQ
ncbi:acetyl esterase/lipase [Neisseria sp. HSC-16F19]|nr:alpha/beta hydrolase [Neisseria sp. HSC-16F19]MCP2040762.1 acetyl esterase/lipase [Neisseria sp. HSC-16F19]